MESKSPQNKIPKIKEEQTTPEQKSNHNTHKQTEKRQAKKRGGDWEREGE